MDEEHGGDLTPREQLEWLRLAKEQREHERAVWEKQANAAGNAALRALVRIQRDHPELVPDEGLTPQQAVEIDTALRVKETTGRAARLRERHWTQYDQAMARLASRGRHRPPHALSLAAGRPDSEA